MKCSQCKKNFNEDTEGRTTRFNNLPFIACPLCNHSQIKLSDLKAELLNLRHSYNRVEFYHQVKRIYNFKKDSTLGNDLKSLGLTTDFIKWELEL